jgi:hypothetical protein
VRAGLKGLQGGIKPASGRVRRHSGQPQQRSVGQVHLGSGQSGVALQDRHQFVQRILGMGDTLMALAPTQRRKMKRWGGDNTYAALTTQCQVLDNAHCASAWCRNWLVRCAARVWLAPNSVTIGARSTSDSIKPGFEFADDRLACSGRRARNRCTRKLP